jgi:hypothetical protein
MPLFRESGTTAQLVCNAHLLQRNGADTESDPGQRQTNGYLELEFPVHAWLPLIPDKLRHATSGCNDAS